MSKEGRVGHQSCVNERVGGFSLRKVEVLTVIENGDRFMEGNLL